jgi:protein transport protein SEC31
MQIFSLEYSRPGKQLVRVGEAVQAPERFARVSWADASSEFPQFKHGLLAGGLSDGTVCVWNPSVIIDPSMGHGDVSKSSLLCRLNKHQGAVRGLEFNPFSAKLLASGAADGEVCIWDLANPSQPSLYPAMKGAGVQNQITCLEWNRKVQHILATGTSSGSVVVWDLKKQRPVITLSDSNGRRKCSSIAWNPDIATQVMVASDDDATPTLQLWDLRNAVSPVAELSAHTKGVLSLDWSPHDSSMLLSSGKDNRVVVWDVPSRQPRQEMSSGPNWNFQVQWSNKRQPGMFAGGTFEGLIGIHSLSSCPPAVLPDGQTSIIPSTKPAEWDKKPVAGASFGFGGKLLKITNAARQLPTGEVVTTATAEIDQLHLEGGVSKLSPEFENVIKSADRDSLRTLCETRAASSQDPEEGETWRFLQTLFEDDTQHQLLTMLGFDPSVFQKVQEQNAVPPPVETAQQDFGAMSLGGDGQQQQRQEVANSLIQQQNDVHRIDDDGSAFFSQSPVDGDAFFDQLGSPNPMSAKASQQPPSDAVPDVAPVSPPVPKISDGIPGEAEGDIQKALFVGNYELALETCLGANRFSDALILAAMMGGDVWEKTRDKVMSAQPRPYMRIIHAALDGDWNGFIQSRPSQRWRETLATLLTSAPTDQFAHLVGVLGQHLLQSGARHASLLCSICAGDVESAVSLWNETAGPEASPKAKEALLEKAVILGLGVDKSGSSSALGDLLAKQAEELASAGQLAAAYDLLCLVPGDTSAKANDLRDRLYQGGALDQPSAQAPAPYQQDQHTSQSWDDTFQQQNTYTQETYSAQPPQDVFAPPMTSAQPPAYTAQPYKPSPPASPYSTMSSSQPYAPSYQNMSQSAGLAPPPAQPQVFTPAQPIQNAPPTSFSAPPPTSFQSSAPATAPPQQYNTVGPSPPMSPQSYQPSQPAPQVYQHNAPSSEPQTSFAQQPQQPVQEQSYVPSAPPPQVYQPTGFNQQTFSGGVQPQQQPQQTFQPSAPVAPQKSSPPPTPAKPAGPPANVALMTVDASKIPGNLAPIVNSLRSLYQAAEQFAVTQPARKRELDDASKKLGGLVWKINEGLVSDSVTSKLLQLAASLDAYDYPGAAHVQVQLTTSDWDECSSWLTALKRLIKIRQMSH